MNRDFFLFKYSCFALTQSFDFKQKEKKNRLKRLKIKRYIKGILKYNAQKKDIKLSIYYNKI